MTISTSSIQHPDYNEAQALQELMIAASEAITEMNDKYEETDNYDYMDGSFTINVGGKSIAFLHGGPQHQALCIFIDSIAEENGYAVDYRNHTVIE